MKFRYILPILLIILFTISCSTDDNEAPIINEIEGLIKVQDITNTTHTIELFNTTGDFRTGYNNVSIRIKEKASSSYIKNASISWIPMMQMPSMQHSCPKSEVTKSVGKETVYEGFVIYQMTNTDGSGWSLTVNYTIDGTDYTASSDIVVLQSEKQNTTSFMGSDDSRYIIALIEPNEPKIAINDLKVGLFKMKNMMTFPVVEDYTITLDPRMPGMGNHSSPNNTDLSYNAEDHMYHGNLSLTMTGYWVLNLKLINDHSEVLKGEDVTEDHTKSSLYLELEF
ncbi:hypothetical protein [Jejuia spongiicola]|uniref:YtkA-like domain-containing protein n=1 Tax=Jejuia spongiicola TaxID=2942207 RepID=A0ABT0QJN7_9FLAO|nr:hypothetical protein [Jejuia spongiicola]MCL6296200.1 hypothetical protein [Jejuia spongiicola]